MRGILLFFLAALALPAGLAHGQSGAAELDLSDPKPRTVDVVHLGARQIDRGFDPMDGAATLRPTRFGDELRSAAVATRNGENGRLDRGAPATPRQE